MRIWINSTLKAIKATIVASRILRKATIVAFSTEPVKHFILLLILLNSNKQMLVGPKNGSFRQ